MSLPQKKFREIVFQILYSYDMGNKNEGKELIELLMKELCVTKRSVTLAEERAFKILQKCSEIDEKIAKITESYEFDRIQAVERNILRLASYEILFDEEIPPKVAIAEAIRLSRKFSTPESASFVNAILDALYKQAEGQTTDKSEIHEAIESLSKEQELASEVIKRMGDRDLDDK